MPAEDDHSPEPARKGRGADKRRRKDHIVGIAIPRDDLRPQRRFEEPEDSRADLHNLDVPKPYKVTALPPIGRRLRTMRPMPGVSRMNGDEYP